MPAVARCQRAYRAAGTAQSAKAPGTALRMQTCHRGSRGAAGAAEWARLGVGLAAGCAMAILGSAMWATPAAATQAAPAARFAWDGVYTDLQADRGEREYGRTCFHCHGLALEGDGAREIPTLVSDPFMRRWRGRSVQALFDALRRSMPADDLGSLTPRATADMVAYLLRINGAPAGETPLPSAREALHGHRHRIRSPRDRRRPERGGAPGVDAKWSGRFL